MYKNYFKRFLDFIIGVLAFVILSPLIIILIVLLMFANSGAGVFFIQKRPGLNGKIFKVVKFKTMNEKKNQNGKLLPDAERITKLGRFVRSTSLDELPQLLNVINGDMALVGPRPLLIKYLPLYSDFQNRRHDVRPGITGWAQVNGRNAISWDKKFELDVYYVENLSFSLDVKIILSTIKKVFWREGISSGSSATMETFTGNSENGSAHYSDS